MLTQEFITYSLGIVALLNVGATVWISIRKPQQTSEVNDAVFETKFCALKDIVVNLRDNHLHTVESKLDRHIEDNQRKAELDAKWQGKIEVLLEQISKR